MLSSLRALLAHAIDYAGLFPPAELPLAVAVRHYAGYLKDPDRPLLGRFICPAARLGDLAQTLERQLAFTRSGEWAVSILATGGSDADGFLAHIRQDRAAAQALRARYPTLAVGDVFEARLPQTPGRVADFLSQVSAAAPEASFYYELTLPGDAGAATGEIDRFTTALADFNRGCGGERRVHFKLRCGGASPQAYPAAEVVAAALAFCRDKGLRLKFTAGLHHPFRHFNQAAATRMHGFLNVLVAGVLAHARAMPASALVPILEDEDPKHFWFDEEGLGHGNGSSFRAGMAEVEQARVWLPGFGSCSFDEPRQDLRAAGLL